MKLRLAVLSGLVSALALIPGPATAAESSSDFIEVKRCPVGYSGVVVTNNNNITGSTTVWACVENP